MKRHVDYYKYDCINKQFNYKSNEIKSHITNLEEIYSNLVLTEPKAEPNLVLEKLIKDSECYGCKTKANLIHSIIFKKCYNITCNLKSALLHSIKKQLNYIQILKNKHETKRISARGCLCNNKSKFKSEKQEF